MLVQEDLQRLSQLSLFIFTPCILLTQMAKKLTVDDVKAYWPMPLWAFIHFFLNWALSLILVRIGNPSPRFKREFVAASVCGNFLSLPLVLIPPLASSEVISSADPEAQIKATILAFL